ncbi:MAG: YwaF family protein [Acholeplasmatales bacterium]|jgi:uncharacterized membrane protein YwaF|nr:YwaF family protein [Acholeplasmatales bacterium]
MIVVDVLICLLLMGLVIFLNYKKKTRNLYLDLGLGLFYIVTYLVWRYQSNSYDFGTFFHIYIFLSSFVTPFIIYYYTKYNDRSQRIAEIVIASLGFFIIVSRFITWPLFGFRFADTLPLNICNIMAVITFIGLFIKNNSLIKNLTLSLGVLGGILTISMGFNEGFPTIWFIQNIDSYLLHYSLIVYPIYIFLTNRAKIDIKLFIKSFYLVLIYYVIIYFVNIIVDENFIFTKPGYVDFLTDIYNSLPEFKISVFNINILYIIICLSGTFLCSLLSLFFFKTIKSRLEKLSTTPQEVVDNTI